MSKHQLMLGSDTISNKPEVWICSHRFLVSTKPDTFSVEVRLVYVGRPVKGPWACCWTTSVSVSTPSGTWIYLSGKEPPKPDPADPADPALATRRPRLRRVFLIPSALRLTRAAATASKASALAGRVHPGVYLGQSLRFSASPDQPSQHPGSDGVSRA